MKKVQIQTFLLAFVIMVPLVVTSVTNLTAEIDAYELCESTEEEQKEERDGVEEFIVHNGSGLITTHTKGVEYYSRHYGFFDVSSDVLTPPPEYLG